MYSRRKPNFDFTGHRQGVERRTQNHRFFAEKWQADFVREIGHCSMM
jgi:hypothetical protein